MDFLQSYHFSYQIVRSLTRFFILKKKMPCGTVLRGTQESNPEFKFQRSYPFQVLKKWGDRFCWGPGARAERAGGGRRYLSRPIRGEIGA
jgi:hypothetical protein